jgi:hypothetical protein
MVTMQVPRRAHLPLRPLWLCRVCAGPWPCAPARLALKAEYVGNLVALSIYMATMLYEAAADLHRLNPEPGQDPAELYARFIRWTRYTPPPDAPT